MRSLDLASINERPDSLKDQLLFCNNKLTTVRWIRNLIDRDGPHCIKTTENGLSFPLELWVMILDQAEAMALEDPNFIFVKIQSIKSHTSASSSKEDTKIVRCVPQKFTLPYTPVAVMKDNHYDDGQLLAGNLHNPASCDDLESFLKCATPEMAAKINAQEVNDEDMTEDWFVYYTHKSTTRIPELVELPDQTFDVIFHPGSYSVISGLFHQLTVPDVIAWVDGGRCWVCSGGRFLCPGGRCPGTPAKYLWDFAHVGCGYEVSCPLCMGDIFDEHMSYIRSEHRGYDNSDWEQKMEGKIKGRMEMSGYKYSPPIRE